MRKSRAEKFREETLAPQAGSLRIESLVDVLMLLLGGPPNPTQLAFIRDPVPEQAATHHARVKGYMGPLGCAKTATLAAFAVLRALTVPGARILVSRLTYGELQTTTQERVLEMIYRLPAGFVIDYNRTPPATLLLRSAVVEKAEPSAIVFHSLDDYAKIRSVEFTDAFVDEATEIDEKTIHEIDTRVGRRPKLKSPFFLGMAFNPPSDAHWLYRASVETGYVKLYRPASRENATNLPDGYYEGLAKTLPPDMKRRLIDGEWGSDFAGKPVYPEFVESLHVRPDLAAVPEAPVFWFMDFGYNHPCCLIAQRTHQGHVRILHEIDGERMEIEPFVDFCRAKSREIGLPEPNPEQNGGMWYGDPAAFHHQDTGQTSARLAVKGITLLGRPSRIGDGLALVRLAFSREVDGRRMLEVHPRCLRLISALRGGYRYRDAGEEAAPKLVPHKDDYYDHCADALRYGILNLNLGDYRAIMHQQSVNPEEIGEPQGPPEESDGQSA